MIALNFIVHWAFFAVSLWFSFLKQEIETQNVYTIAEHVGCLKEQRQLLMKPFDILQANIFTQGRLKLEHCKNGLPIRRIDFLQ